MICRMCNGYYSDQLTACPHCGTVNPVIDKTVFADDETTVYPDSKETPASPQEVLPANDPPLDPYRLPQQYNVPPENGVKHTTTALVVLICVLSSLLIIGAAVVLMLLHPWDNGKPEPTETTTVASAATTADNAVKMPDVTGLSKEDAIAKLAGMGIAVKDVKEIETDGKPSGYVFNQIPAKNQEIARGDEAILYIAKAPAVTETATAPVVTVQPVPSDSNGTTLYVIASEDVTLRAEATRTGKKLATISRGEAVTFISANGEFYYVSYNGTKGYILSEFLSVDKNARNDGSGNAGLKSGDYLYCVASDNATLRSFASREASALATVNRGERVSYLGQTDEWFRVSYGGQTGYVLKDYFAAQEDAPLNYGQD